jgi:hypothetical protein
MEIEINVKVVMLHAVDALVLKQINANLAQMFHLFFKRDFVLKIHHATQVYS